MTIADPDGHPCYGDPNLVDDDRQGRICLTCGAYQSLNPESGNVVWMRAGRVISAPVDMLQAKQRHDERYGTNHAGS